MPHFRLKVGDSREVLKKLPDAFVHSIVTDPPYELGFMGHNWDRSGIAYDVKLWKQAWRVLKPGGYLLAFGGSRTYHRLASAVEDAGFEIRDQIMWVYASGFPKSLDVSKALDKAAGAEREVIGRRTDGRYAYEFKGTANRPTGAGAGTDDAKRIGGFVSDKAQVTAPATDAAKQWTGWGTALKPAHEPIVVARKPLLGTVTKNVLQYGTGALNIDGCRVRIDSSERDVINNRSGVGFGTGNSLGNTVGRAEGTFTSHALGRWPANLIHDGSDEVLEEFAKFGDKSSARKSGNPNQPKRGGSTQPLWGISDGRETHDFRDSGTAARFFYCAKASKKDRGAGNNHPTVKPTALMRYLVRLVTPPGGRVVDPFCGSGTTGVAALREGYHFYGIDLEAKHAAIARRRLLHTIETICERTSL